MDDGVDDGVEKVAVVGDQQQRAGIAAEPVLEPQHRVEVEVVGRFVEQQQVGAAHQRLREVQAHPPAAGEARHRIAVARVGKSQAGEECGGARACGVPADRLEAMMQLRQRLAAGVRVGVVGGLGLREPALDLPQLAVAVEHELDRGRGDRRRFLRDVGDRPARGQRDRARVGQDLAANEREQARLAAAVRPDQPRLVPGVERERRAFEQPLGATGEGEVGDAQHGKLDAWRARV